VPTLALCAVISLVWMAGGLAMIVSSGWWRERLERALTDPLGRLLLAQAAILAGLLLVLGAASLRGAWLWMGLGVLAVVKGLAILGAGDRFRSRAIAWWKTLPTWVHRLSGLAMVVLATLLMIDALGAAS